MSNQDPVFNFTSYLCSPDGCKMILWKCATAAPSRGVLPGIRSSHGEHRGRSPSKWGWMSRNRSCFKVDSDTRISTGKTELVGYKKKEKNTLKTTKPLSILMPTVASVLGCFPPINIRYLIEMTPREKKSIFLLISSSSCPALTQKCPLKHRCNLFTTV